MNEEKDKFKGILHSYLSLIFVKTEKGHELVFRYFLFEIVIPMIIAILSFIFRIRLQDAGIIVSALGVLGGLLFAHAIFVFQLRGSYSRDVVEERRSGIQIFDERIPGMIDEMFVTVVYSSALALAITLITGVGSSMCILYVIPDLARRILFALLLGLLVHLAACIWHVLRITTSAYQELQK